MLPTLIIAVIIEATAICLLIWHLRRTKQKYERDDAIMRSMLQDILGTLQQGLAAHLTLKAFFEEANVKFGRDYSSSMERIHAFIVEQRQRGVDDSVLLDRVMALIKNLGQAASVSAAISELGVKVSRDPRHRDR